jgi:hypothetical protein
MCKNMEFFLKEKGIFDILYFFWEKNCCNKKIILIALYYARQVICTLGEATPCIGTLVPLEKPMLTGFSVCTMLNLSGVTLGSCDSDPN